MLAVFQSAVREGARKDYSDAQRRVWAPDAPDREAWAKRRAGRPTWVAELEGVPVGFIDLEPDGHIDMLFVAAEQHRRGIAQALYQRLEKEARERGLRRLHTEASITARPFFERQGFTVEAEQTVALRGQTFINYRMAKRLERTAQ